MTGKYKGLLADIKEKQSGTVPADEPPLPSPAPPPKVHTASPEPVIQPEKKDRGGKRSDKKNYSQGTHYLRNDTKKRVKRRLEDLGTGQDFSELLEELLVRWLKETE